jgi:hypothetical protein
MSGFSEWMAGLREGRVQAITEDYGGLPHDEPRTITYMGREFPAPVPNHWNREYIEQRTREIEEAADRYAAGLEAERREAELRHREAEARAMHHMWCPTDNESNDGHRNLSFDSETGEITNAGGTLLNEAFLFNPDSVSPDSLAAGTGITTISNVEPTWELSISDAISDKYKEMEKRVEEQDKTIAEMKSIIENLQDIIYQRKLDKEAETLVL